MTPLSSVETAIRMEIDGRREELVDLCARLVAAPSINPPGNTSEVAKVVCDYLSAEGFAPDIVARETEAPNIVVQTGPSAGPHVVFNAHMDTMQAGDASAWSVPVMELTRRDGRLYGLGMGNMKGGLAAMCLAISTLRRKQAELNGRATFTAVSDEVMFGDRGTEYLLSRRPDLFGDYMICAEGPGDMDFAVAEKGLLWVDVTANGEGGHSSRAISGASSVAKLADFLTRIDALNEIIATLPEELAGVESGEENSGLRVSASAGVIEAGEVRSLMPVSASAFIDIRVPPGVRVAELKQMITGFCKSLPGLTVSFPKEWDPSWARLDQPLVSTLAGVASEVRNTPPRYVVRLPGSDARHWRNRGTPSVCFGPQPTLSAGVDDYANESDVVDCAKIYALTALRLMDSA